MGADFIFAIAKECEQPEDAKARIDLLPQDTLAEVAMHAWGELPEDDDWQLVRDLLKEAIDIAYEPYGRDLGTIHVTEPGTYVITGGMTWGDDPTEACRPLWALQVSELEYD